MTVAYRRGLGAGWMRRDVDCAPDVEIWDHESGATAEIRGADKLSRREMARHRKALEDTAINELVTDARSACGCEQCVGSKPVYGENIRRRHAACCVEDAVTELRRPDMPQWMVDAAVSKAKQ